MDSKKLSYVTFKTKNEAYRMYILVVDDDPTSTYAFKYILEKNGLICQTASSGNEALSIILRSPPLLILTDYNMPDGNGMNLIKDVRNKGMKIPIMMMSGQKVEFSQEEIENLRIAHIYKKPVSIKEFLNHAKLILASV